MQLSLSACKLDVFHWNTGLVFILALLLSFLVALWILSVLLIFIWDFFSISLSLDSSSFLLLSVGLPPEKKGDADIYTKGKSSPSTKVVLCDKPITILLKHSFNFPIVDVQMSGSWSLLSNGDTSMCPADATPLTFVFGSSVADSARDDLNKKILANISSLWKILTPEAYLINRFFVPSTSLILLAYPNISCWISSITAGIHSENIWDYGSSVEKYPDPSFLS